MWRLLGILAVAILVACFMGAAPGLVPFVFVLTIPWALRGYQVVTDRRHKIRFETAHDLLTFWRHE